MAVAEMKKRIIVLGLIALAVLFASIYLRGPGTVPAGQKPVVTLSSKNISGFEAAFDENPDMPRLVLMLSPT